MKSGVLYKRTSVVSSNEVWLRNTMDVVRVIELCTHYGSLLWRIYYLIRENDCSPANKIVLITAAVILL